MVLCRCLSHSPPKRGDYLVYTKPLGYPNSSVICGIKECKNSAIVWLSSDELDEYKNGVRIFNGPTNFTKVKVDNSGFFNKILEE